MAGHDGRRKEDIATIGEDGQRAAPCCQDLGRGGKKPVDKHGGDGLTVIRHNVVISTDCRSAGM